MLKKSFELGIYLVQVIERISEEERADRLVSYYRLHFQTLESRLYLSDRNVKIPGFKTHF